MSDQTLVLEKVSEHEQLICALANSDTRCAKYASALLDLAEIHGGGD
jgi:hypothetical protein